MHVSRLTATQYGWPLSLLSATQESLASWDKMRGRGTASLDRDHQSICQLGLKTSGAGR